MHRNSVRSNGQAARVGYIGEGACNCGSNFLAPPLCRILWILSWRTKKVSPPAGTGTSSIEKGKVLTLPAVGSCVFSMFSANTQHLPKHHVITRRSAIADRRGNPFSLGEPVLHTLGMRIATPVCALRLAKSRLCRLLACTRLRAQWFAMTVYLTTFSFSHKGFGAYDSACCAGDQ